MNTETKQHEPTLRDIITAGLRKIGREDVVAMLADADSLPNGLDEPPTGGGTEAPGGALRAAFTWADMPQGREFWRAIARDLESITITAGGDA